MLIIFALFGWLTHASQLCEILTTANSGAFSPRQLCEAYRGSFCSGVKSMPEAICAAGNGTFCTDITLPQVICQLGGGSFCSGVKNEIEAMCEADHGSFCSNLAQPDRLRYWQAYRRCISWSR